MKLAPKHYDPNKVLYMIVNIYYIIEVPHFSRVYLFLHIPCLIVVVSHKVVFHTIFGILMEKEKSL